MSATNPFRTSDLIAKYGWKSMVYLSNLGITHLAEAQVLFVDSGSANALDKDDGEHGHSFEKPLATIDYAIGLCTASEGSVILVAPGHNEGLGAATIDFDVAGITCIGIGNGDNRPTIDYDNTAASVDIGANNVRLVNLRFRPSVSAVLIGVDVEAGVTGTVIEDCEFTEGEAATDEFVLSIDVKAGCTDTQVKNCLFRTIVNAAQATDAIKLTGASDNCIIKDCRFIGNWSNAAITTDTTLSTDLLIDNVTIKVADGATGIKCLTGTTGIIREALIEATGTSVDSMIVADSMSWFNNYGVTADGSAAELIGGGEVGSALVTYKLDHLVSAADGTGAYPATLANDSIIAMQMCKGATATPSTFDNTTDSQEAISDKLGAFAGTSGAGATESAKALLDLVHTDVDAILADSIQIADGTLPAAPTAGSLARFIATGGTALGTQLPASTSLYDVALAQGAIANNLDHLAKTAIADITDPVDMTAEVVDNSILANILTDDGDMSEYDRRYQSIEALAKLLRIQMGYQLRSIAGSAMPIAVWFVDSNIASSGNGKTPATAFKTIQEAITACTTTADDWILVYDYSGGEAATITINKPFVHLIGNGCKGMAYPRIKPTGNFDGITITDAGDRVEIANMVIGGGTQGYSAITFSGAGGSYGVYIHDCIIGRDADAPALYGVYVPAGCDAPYLVLENNKFQGMDGAGIAAAGSAIRIAGNATQGSILGNYIQDVGRTATPAIWVDGSGTCLRIENNRIKTDTDTGTGSAITLSANVDDSWIAGNWASDGKDAPAQNPFVDAGSTNGWSVNYQGIVMVLPA